MNGLVSSDGLSDRGGRRSMIVCVFLTLIRDFVLSRRETVVDDSRKEMADRVAWHQAD